MNTLERKQFNQLLFIHIFVLHYIIVYLSVSFLIGIPQGYWYSNIVYTN